jgi:hypothetical protein
MVLDYYRSRSGQRGSRAHFLVCRAMFRATEAPEYWIHGVAKDFQKVALRTHSGWSRRKSTHSPTASRLFFPQITPFLRRYNGLPAETFLVACLHVTLHALLANTRPLYILASVKTNLRYQWSPRCNSAGRFFFSHTREISNVEVFLQTLYTPHVLNRRRPNTFLHLDKGSSFGQPS